MLARRPTARRTDLVTGSAIEILTQSARSVRGQRVHRLKCDEVDEFLPAVWQAAQFTTQSGRGTDGQWIPAQMEVFSTMHRPFGLMADLVDRITRCDPLAAPLAGREGETPLALGPLLLTWCLWEVIERCGPERSCSRCPLWADCEGRSREAEGYFPIDDAIAQKSRASRPAWEAEMLCLRPRTDGIVFSDFDPARHVAPVAYDASLPLYRALDFGYANPFVCLWVQVKGHCGLRIADCGLNGKTGTDLSAVQVRVIGEYVARERPIADHARTMAARDPGPVLATWADPAGWQRSDVTGTGPCQELASLGLRVRTPHAGILEGIELVRRLLKDRGPAAESGLVIDPSCRWLVRALQEYHWEEGPEGRRSETPAKDGADHPIDALRYLMTGLFLGRGRIRERRW
jgi:hypothetical protein